MLCNAALLRRVPSLPQSRRAHTEAPGHAEWGRLSWGFPHISSKHNSPSLKGPVRQLCADALQGRHSSHRLTLVLLKGRLGYRKGRTWTCKQGHLYCGCKASSGMAECQIAFDHDHAVLGRLFKQNVLKKLLMTLRNATAFLAQA